MAKRDKTTDLYQVACPDCGAMLKIDPVTHAVISHTSAPKPKMFSDLDEATRALKDQDSRRESLFRQSVEAEKNKGDVLEKKFQEALKKAKETPTERPIRDFDLD